MSQPTDAELDANLLTIARQNFSPLRNAQIAAVHVKAVRQQVCEDGIKTHNDAEVELVTDAILNALAMLAATLQQRDDPHHAS
jgi:hypothetical protein